MPQAYEVIILKPGYATWKGPNRQAADGTITLIKGLKRVIVDTGNPDDKEFIMQALERHGLKPDDINYVVCTHGHSDHTGNNNLFSNATFIVSYDISKGDDFTFHPFANGVPFRIDSGVEIVSTPGHGAEDISVLVRTPNGIIAIVGDLFEGIDDLKNEELWKAFSKFPEQQRSSRDFILSIADFIIPGHGHMFRIDPSFKKQQ
jgi:glyoxylase-like metal-dependent hydrolase (beta-lactamase superfamily II)